MTGSVALLLKELRLPAFHRHYQSLWETAIEKNWSHTDYLAALCEYELSDRYQRRTAYSGDSDHPYWFYPITCST